MTSRTKRADAEQPHDSKPATNEEIARSRTGAEVFAELGLSAPKPRGRPRAANPKVPVSLRIDPDTLAAFKATGEGWQSRMNNALDEAAARLASQK